MAARSPGISRLAVFALQAGTELPISRMPVYAEIVILADAQEDEVEADPALGDVIVQALRQDAIENIVEPQPRRRLRELLGEEVRRQLGVKAAAMLRAGGKDPSEFLLKVIARARTALKGAVLRNVEAAALKRAVREAMRSEAARQGLTLEPVQPTRQTRWAYPLGVLATDHVGYLSYDLTTMPASVRQALAAAVDLRRKDPAALLDVTVSLIPTGLPGDRFEALSQGRFSADAVVARLEMLKPGLPDLVTNLALPAMQTPSLTDWRLSPGSFAANPASLVGADGCESILPANVAVQEFNLSQVVRLTDVQSPAAPVGAARVQLGVINEYRVSWRPLGHSLGQILYSLPLAPGESVNLAVVDWTRRDESQRKERTTVDEQLVHNEHRDRVISETVDAAVREYQHGSSFMGGIAGAIGVAAKSYTAGIAGSLGGITSNSSGTRSMTASTLQKVNDNIAQISSASRELQSTVVVQSTQTEKETIETRTIVNYNHSHTLTILYYEVLRHFRICTELVRHRAALLVKIKTDWFEGAEALKNAGLFRNSLESALLDAAVAGGFAAIERKAQQQRVQSAIAALGKPDVAVPAPVPDPGEREFLYFKIEMTAGDLTAEGSERVWILGSLIGASGATQLWNLAFVPDESLLNPNGAFVTEKGTNVFHVGLKPPAVTIKWKDISAVQLAIDLNGVDDLALSHIRITGRDTAGNDQELADQAYESGNLIIKAGPKSEGRAILLPTTRPPFHAAPPSGRPQSDVDDEIARTELVEHLRRHAAHYARAIYFGREGIERAAELDAIALSDGSTALSKVENRPIDMVGDFMAFPLTDDAWSNKVEASLDVPGDDALMSDERLVALPTRGVFAEAKLGHCNASEEIDKSRFWDWQSSPIPHLAPEIASVQPVTPQSVQPAGLQPAQFPASLLNIVNPPSAPDPHGLTTALAALATANIFRDMSGRGELTDLLKKLSDNSVAIAGLAQKSNSGGVAPSGQGSSSGGGTSGGASGSMGGSGTTGGGAGPINSGSSGTGISETGGGGGSAPQAPQTQEQRQSLQNENHQAQLNIAERLPIPQRRKIEEKVVNDIVGTREWIISVKSEWLGASVKAPLDATFSGTIYFDKNTQDGGEFLDQVSTNELVVWKIKHEGRPTHLNVYFYDIKPITLDLNLSVPALTVEGVTLQAKTYQVPLRTLGKPLHDTTFRDTATIDKAKVDLNIPTLSFIGTLMIDKKDIEVSFELSGGAELGGDLARAFEASGNIEVVKLAASATMKAAAKATVNGKAGIKGTIEVLYVKGYELKLAP